MDGWVDERRKWVDRRMEGRTGGRIGGCLDGRRIDRQMEWCVVLGSARSARCGRTIGWADPLADQDYLYKCDSKSFTPPQKSTKFTELVSPKSFFY